MLFPINAYSDYYSSLNGVSAFAPYQVVTDNTYPLAPSRRANDEHSPKEEKELPASLYFIKEAAINGLTIAASMAGGKVSGARGAILSGAIASASLGIVDQKLILNQKLDWISVALDGLLGLIPGRLPENIAIGGRNLLKRRTGIKLNIGTRDSIRRAVAIGVTDGFVLGSVGGFVQSFYDNAKEDRMNWGDVFGSTLAGTFPAIVGGGIGAGLFMHYWKSHPQAASRLKSNFKRLR